MSDLDLCYTPATELAARVRAKDISPVERLLVAGDPKLHELAVAQLANKGGGPDGPAVG